MMRTQIDRRALLQLSAGGIAFAAGATARASAVVGEKKIVFVILRGAMDGLSALPPVGDDNYYRRRGEIAIPRPGMTGGAIALSGDFGLHPSMKFLAESWLNGEMAALPAASSPYRERSHFDGQDVLENGGVSVFGQSDGWLNRALAAAQKSGVALAPSLPLVLRGPADVANFAPSIQPAAEDDTISRLMDLYATDPELAPAFAKGVETSMMVGDDIERGGGRNNLAGWPQLATSLATLMSGPTGAAAGVIAFDGWDTHANQGAATGLLANRLGALDESLRALKAGLGDGWKTTAVIVATEFGRTVSINGTRGTDHGTGGAAFLLGGSVKGKRILGDWPGLADRELYENRDVAPANDLRALFKGVIAAQWKLDPSVLAKDVFPGSGVGMIGGLIAA